MKATQEFTFGFARATLSLDGEGVAQVKMTGVVARLADFQRWVQQRCEDVHARGCVIDFRRAIMAIDWADYMGDPADSMPGVRLLPVAVVANPALLDELRDWTWCRAKQGHMRSVFQDAVSASTWAAARGWIGSL